MSRTKKCTEGTKPFSFELPITDGITGFGSLTIDGFGCKENGKTHADIDRVEFEGVDVKPLLEMFSGMKIVDAAADTHVKQMFETELQTAA